MFKSIEHILIAYKNVQKLSDALFCISENRLYSTSLNYQNALKICCSHIPDHSDILVQVYSTTPESKPNMERQQFESVSIWVSSRDFKPLTSFKILFIGQFKQMPLFVFLKWCPIWCKLHCWQGTLTGGEKPHCKPSSVFSSFWARKKSFNHFSDQGTPQPLCAVCLSVKLLFSYLQHFYKL